MRGNFTGDVIEKTLEGLAQRFQATSQNIANMNTRKYARREVLFEDELREVVNGPSQLPLRTTDPNHISNVATDPNAIRPRTRLVDHEPYRLDQNNVDPEAETARLAQTRMLYAAMAQRMGGKFKALRRSIGGGQ